MIRSDVSDLFDLLLTASHTQLQTFWSEHNEVSWTGCEVLIVYFNLLRWGMTSARLRSSALSFLPAWPFRTKPEKVATNPYAYVPRTQNLSSRPVSGWTAAHSSSTKMSRCFCAQGTGPGRPRPSGQWSFTRLPAAGQRPRAWHLESQQMLSFPSFWNALPIDRRSEVTTWIKQATILLPIQATLIYFYLFLSPMS